MKFKLFAKIPVGTIVYKKVCEYNTCDKNTVLTCVVVGPGFCPGALNGPVNARKYRAENDKCRVRAVVPISAERNVNGRWYPCTDEHYMSVYDNSFTYTLNKVIAEPKFCTNKKTVCASGIHVFLTKNRARNY